MRTICLDIGEKRIGVAVSDLLDLTAQGVETIWTKGNQKVAARVAELCSQYETTHILCGLPLNMDGSEGFQAQRVKVLANTLQDMGFEIRYQDERLTTKMATSVLLQADVRRSKRKEVVDKLAATYILQSFLDAGGWKDLPAREEHKKVFQSEVWYMSENMNNQDMELEQENIVVLVDDDGNEVTFEHLMNLEHKGKVYICLVPAEPMDDVDEDELVIMRIEQDADGNDFYSTIDNEKELQEVYEEYLEIAEADDEE
jgi:putative Holliday junction resolvase